MGILTKPFMGIDKKIKPFLSTLLPQIIRLVVVAACLASKYYWRRHCRKNYMLIVDERSSRFICRRKLLPNGERLPAEDCAICLSELDGSGGEEGRELACKHSFHRKCVDRWLTGDGLAAGTCPICRRVVVPREMAEDYESTLSKEEVFEFEKELALILLSTLHHRTCNES